MGAIAIYAALAIKLVLWTGGSGNYCGEGLTGGNRIETGVRMRGVMTSMDGPSEYAAVYSL